MRLHDGNRIPWRIIYALIYAIICPFINRIDNPYLPLDYKILETDGKKKVRP